MKKILLFAKILIFINILNPSSFSKGLLDAHYGKEGPPPAGAYRLGYKEFERAIKIEKKGKFKKAKVKFEKALEYFLEANADDPANPDILNYLGLSNAKLGFKENAEIYYLLGLELNNEHKSIKFNLGIFYFNENRVNKAKEVLNSLKNCKCEEFDKLSYMIN